MKRLGVLAVVLLALLSVTGCYVAGDAARGARTISMRTLDGDNILANYEWYHSTYTEVIAKVSVYNNYKHQLAVTKDQDMLNRMLVEQNGVMAYITDLCGQYNARSKMVNRALFKDRNLPFTIDFAVTEDGTGVLKEGM